MQDTVWCEYCDVAMISNGDSECFECPKCGDVWGWDSYYEHKASLRYSW